MLIFDLYGCDFIPSKGFATLISISKQCRGNEVVLGLQNLSEDLVVLFELTRIDTLFDLTPRKEFEKKCAIILPDFDEINRELMDYFARNPERLTDLNWRKFELLLNAVFQNHGYRTEIGLGGADGGVDLRLMQSDVCGEILTLVQAKKYHKKHPVRLGAVQAFCAVIDDQKANRGLFVTTSRYLPGVHEFAERQRHRLTLADSTDVARWCEGAVRKMIESHQPVI